MHTFVRVAAAAFLTLVMSSQLSLAQESGLPSASSAPSPYRTTIITSKDIQRRNIARLDELFQGSVPGFITLDRPASQQTTWQGRGVAGLGIPTRIRVFLDGVELDNPAYINRINPEYVDQIEVTTGLATGAEYGATGGVIRIITKQGSSGNKGLRPSTFRPTISTLLSAGSENSLYNEGASLSQRHAINIAGGAQRFNYFLGGGYAANGNYAPETKAHGSDALLGLSTQSRYVSVRVFGAIGSNTSNIPSARFWSPEGVGPSEQQTKQSRVKNNTFGGTVTVTLTPWWRQELRAGSSYSDNTSTGILKPVPSNDSYRTIHEDQHARRLSYGYTSAFVLPKIWIVQPTLRAGYEHTRYATTGDTNSRFFMPGTPPSENYLTISQRQELTSYFATIGTTVGSSFALDAGVRRGRDHQIQDSEYRYHWMPYASAAYAFMPGIFRVTTRAAYGAVNSKGIDPSALFGGFPPSFPSTVTSVRQRMIGSEMGIDIEMTGGPAFSVTLFDQHGRDGVANPLAPSEPFVIGSPLIPTVVLDQMMVTLATRGAELSAQWSKGSLETRATYSVAKTTVDKVHPQYPNDPGNPNHYTVGQALSTYPRQIGALWVAYTWAKTTFGTEARYLGSYTGRDYLAQPDPSAQARTYKASTLYNLTLTHPLASRVTAIGYIQNLTNTERYESTNAEYVRGRRVGIGMRAEY